jgi:hypothetical protein
MPFFDMSIVNSGIQAVATGISPKTTMTVPNPTGTTARVDAEINWITNESEKTHTMNLEEIDQPAILTINSIDDGSIKFMTNKFFLQGITKPKLERFQIIETFRESKLFFFGQRTKVYNVQGMLLEALSNEPLSPLTPGFESFEKQVNDQMMDQFRWSTAFQTFYDEQLRGTKLTENNCIAGLYFERSSIIGYPLQLQIQRDSTNPHLVQFQMTWAVFKEEFLNNHTQFLYTPEKGATAQDKANLAKAKADFIAARKASDEAQIKYTKVYQDYLATPGSDLLTKRLATVSKEQDAANAKLSAADNTYRQVYRNMLIARIKLGQ